MSENERKAPWHFITHISTHLSDMYCCRSVFPIQVGIYFIAFHTIFHGFFACCFILTTYYKEYFLVLNATIIATQASFVLVGLHTFWAVLNTSWKGSLANAVFLILAGIANLTTSIAYLVVYFKFLANSLLDKVIFWKREGDWINQGDLPFTVWHAYCFIKITVTFVWFYYGFVLVKFYRALREKEKKRARKLSFILDPFVD